MQGVGGGDPDHQRDRQRRGRDHERQQGWCRHRDPRPETPIAAVTPDGDAAKVIHREPAEIDSMAGTIRNAATISVNNNWQVKSGDPAWSHPAAATELPLNERASARIAQAMIPSPTDKRRRGGKIRRQVNSV